MASLFAALLLPAERARAQIDIDADPPSASTALIFSKEYLRPSTDVPRGFYKVGEVGADDARMQTRGTLGRARFLSTDGTIWIRYDLDEHLVFHGTAPMLFSYMPHPDTPGQTIDVLDGGLRAINPRTFAEDGYLLFSYRPLGQETLPEATTLELDLRNVLATSGRDDGTIRLRAFREVEDALSGDNAFGLDQQATVVRVANSIGVTTTPLTQTATVLLFTQFAVGSRVPLGGFEIEIDATHRRPDGSPVPSAPASETLEAFNVDVKSSRVNFSGEGGFAFAPAVGGWTLEQVDPETGLCYGDAAAAAGGDGTRGTADDVSARAVHPVRFGTENSDYPAGPARADLLLQHWHLCATVPEDNEQPIFEGDYYLTVTFVPTTRAPFPPTGVEDELFSTIRHEGTTVHIPYLTADAGHLQRLTIVNRNSMAVAYRLTFRPGQGGTADPASVDGLALPGVTTIKLPEVTTLRGVTWASATLRIVSSPRMIDVATIIVNRGDQSTDTTVYHLGKQDS